MVDDNRRFCAGIYLCRGSLGMGSSQRDSERAAQEQDDIPESGSSTNNEMTIAGDSRLPGELTLAHGHFSTWAASRFD